MYSHSLKHYDKVQTKDQVSKAKFHQVERWRDKLIAEGDAALKDLLEKFPDAESQHLRQLAETLNKIRKLVKIVARVRLCFGIC